MSAGLAAIESAGAAVGCGTIIVVAGAAVRRRIAEPRRPTRLALRQRTRRRPSARVRAIAALITVSVLGVSVGWLPVAIGVAGASTAVRLGPISAERRRRRDAHREFPDAIEHVVLLVHAGLTPQLAVRTAAESAPVALGPAFETVVHRLDRGAPFAEALTALPDVLGPWAAPAADLFAAADRYGLPLEPMLEQLASDARAERRRLDEADARRLPVRLTFPLVTCTLPSFVLVAIAPAVIAALSSLGGTTW